MHLSEMTTVGQGKAWDSVKNGIDLGLSVVSLQSSSSIYQSRFLSLARTRGLPRQVKGAGLRTLSRRGSWVQIPPPAPNDMSRTHSRTCLPAEEESHAEAAIKRYLKLLRNLAEVPQPGWLEVGKGSFSLDCGGK